MKKFQEVLPGTLAIIFQKNCESIMKIVGFTILKEYTKIVTELSINKEGNDLLEDFILGKISVLPKMNNIFNKKFGKVNPFMLTNYTKVIKQFMQDFNSSFEEILAAMNAVHEEMRVGI